MINCFSIYHSTEISYPFAIFLLILILIFTLYIIISKKNKEEIKPEPLYYEKDILGLEISVYNHKDEDFKSLDKSNLKIGLFLIIAVFSLFLLYKSPDKTSKTEDVPKCHSLWYDTESSFNQAIENQACPGRYISNPQKTKREKSEYEKFTEEYLYNIYGLDINLIQNGISTGIIVKNY